MTEANDTSSTSPEYGAHAPTTPVSRDVDNQLTEGQVAPTSTHRKGHGVEKASINLAVTTPSSPSGISASSSSNVTPIEESKSVNDPKWPSHLVHRNEIEWSALSVLLQIKPRIPDAFLKSGRFLTGKAFPSDEDYQRIHRYFENSKGSRNVKITNILRITRLCDIEPHPLDGMQKKMLFHANEDKNIGHILHVGFSQKGGISFTDRVAQTLKLSGNISGGWVLLCEVLLGTVLHTNVMTTDLPTDCDSVKVLGKTVPNESENETEDDCVWPLGQNLNVEDEIEMKDGIKKDFRYNEYIVFKSRQARLQYLIQWEMI